MMPCHLVNLPFCQTTKILFYEVIGTKLGWSIRPSLVDEVIPSTVDPLGLKDRLYNWSDDNKTIFLWV